METVELRKSSTILLKELARTPISSDVFTRTLKSRSPAEIFSVASISLLTGPRIIRVKKTEMIAAMESIIMAINIMPRVAFPTKIWLRDKDNPTAATPIFLSATWLSSMKKASSVAAVPPALLVTGTEIS